VHGLARLAGNSPSLFTPHFWSKMIISLQQQLRRLAFCAVAFVLTASSYQASAQFNRFDVSGSVTDSLGVGLRGATVVVLTQADSVLTKFATTAADGAFVIKRVPEGKYIL